MPREQGWEIRKGKGVKKRPSNLLTELGGGEDEETDDVFDEREAREREENERNLELLEAKAETQAVQAVTEAVPEPLAVPTKPEEVVVQPPVEVKSEEKEIEKNNGVVWYEGILDDLKIITYPYFLLDEEDERRRVEVATKLRYKGVKLPPLSDDERDVELNKNRQRIRAAVEFLRDEEKTKVEGFWNSREEALAYLNSIGIGRGGNKLLAGSHEAVDRENDENKAQIFEDLARLTDLVNIQDREKLIDSLETKNVKIKDLVGEVPGQQEQLFKRLKALVIVSKMSPEKMLEYPMLTKELETIVKKLEIG